MGEQHAYDCIQQHPYYISNPNNNSLPTELNDFFIFTAAKMVGLGKQIHHTQELIKKNAGVNASRVDLLLSEYGQLGTFPEFSRHFARSHGQAVMNALAIREFILKQVAAADRTVLTDFVFKPIPPALAAVQSSDAAAAEEAIKNPEKSTSGDFALFAGPGPDTVVTPPALAMKLMKLNSGSMLLNTNVENNPKLTSSKGDSLEALQTYATRDNAGNIYLVVINANPQREITATIAPANFIFRTLVEISELASPNINDENNLSHPNLVTIKRSFTNASVGRFDFTFKKHSITAIKLSGQIRN